MLVAFACNDDHGQYCGRAFGFSACGKRWDLDYDHDDPFHGRVFKVDWKLMTFTMHRVTYPFTADKEWFGSMAWHAFWMKRPAALRLLLAINAQPEWHLTGGTTRVCEWLDRKAGRETRYFPPLPAPDSQAGR